MKNAFKNIILILALSAVIIMVIAILLYDFIPSSSTVAEPNVYTADSKTTKVLSEIAEESSSLNNPTDNTSSSTKSNIVLKSYSITETDLALYSASKDYDKGKADPFADPTSTTDNNNQTGNTNNSGSNNSTSSTTSNSSSGTTTSDGTLFNSTSSK